MEEQSGNGRCDTEAFMSGKGVLCYAKMCLRNVLVQATPYLPERGTAAPAAAEAPTDEVGTAARGDAAANSAPGAALAGAGAVAGDKAGTGPGAVGAKAAAAGANGKTADAKRRCGGSEAREVLEDEAMLMEDAACVKLAYVCLCQHDHASALNYAVRVLVKNRLLPPPPEPKEGRAPGTPAPAGEDAEDAQKGWQFQAENLAFQGAESPQQMKYPSSVGSVTLATLYAAEALLLAGRQVDAKALLGSFVAAKAAPRGLELQDKALAELERTSGSAQSVYVSRRAGASPTTKKAGATQSGGDEVLCGLSANASMGGLSSPAHLSGGVGATTAATATPKEKEGGKDKGGAKEAGHSSLVMYPPCEFASLGDAQCMLYTNLGSLHVQDGKLPEAERCCERALQLQPRALAPLRTLVYILLKKQQYKEALDRLMQGRLGEPGLLGA